MDIVIDSPLRGPVHTVRTEFDEWDATRGAWIAQDTITIETFNPDGTRASTETRVGEHVNSEFFLYDAEGRLTETRFVRNGVQTSTWRRVHNEQGCLVEVVTVHPDGSTDVHERSTYDAFGRRTDVRFEDERTLGGFSYPEGADLPEFASAPVRHGTVTTRHDDAGRPVEELAHDASHELVSQTSFEYDSQGRLVREDQQIVPHRFFRAYAEAERRSAGGPDEAAATIFEALVPRGILRTRTYVYDADGRLSERRETALGGLSTDHTQYRYDGHGDLVEQTDQSSTWPASVDESGAVQASDEERTVHEVRHEYRRDSRGNWVERVVWGRSDLRDAFAPALRYRRAITYY